MSRSKAKGSNFERKVCKALSLWITGGKAEDTLWRSAMSGGRATVAAKQGKLLRRQAGDISAVAPEGHRLTEAYYIECKHYKQLDVAQFFLTGFGKLARFWLTACKEARRHKKQPMLIAQQNFTPCIVVTRPRVLNTLLPNYGDGMIITVISPTLGRLEVRLFDELLAAKPKE